MTMRHVLFDFDGVLCDSLSDAIQAFNSIRKDHFPQLPEVTGQEDMTTVYAGSLRTCLRPWLSEEDSKKFFDLHSAIMATRAPSLNTFPGIGQLLDGLGQNRFSIVTSAYSDAVLKVLAKDPDFDEAGPYEIAGRELRQTKTAKIMGILERLGIGSDEAVYVGDLESDILYCRDVPISIIAVGYGYHPTDYLAKKDPAYVVDSVAELNELLHRLLN